MRKLRRQFCFPQKLILHSWIGDDAGTHYFHDHFTLITQILRCKSYSESAAADHLIQPVTRVDDPWNQFEADQFYKAVRTKLCCRIEAAFTRNTFAHCGTVVLH